MIKKLKMKFLIVTMGILVVVFSVMFLTLNVFMRTSSVRQTENLLQMVAKEDMIPFKHFVSYGEKKIHPPDLLISEPEVMRAGRVFYVKLNSGNDVLDADFEMMFNFSQDDALSFTSTVLAEGKTSGNIENLQYLVVQKDYGKMIVFAERSIETQILEQLIRVSLWVFGITFILLLLVSLRLSDWVVQPVAIAFTKQRRFISDASHELRTPLTIIGANIDALENEFGTSIRFLHIKEQLTRTNLLIHDLLTLAKADENKELLVVSEFDLSKVIKNTTLEFESTAFEKGKSLSYDIEEEISYTGNASQIKQLCAILIDNGINHSYAQGEIKVSLSKNESKVYLSVYNTGFGIAEDEKDKVFDRFYRSDDSRSRKTGGYGLGLAIAHSIVTAHKGKISVTGKPGQWVEFIVIL